MAGLKLTRTQIAAVILSAGIIIASLLLGGIYDSVSTSGPRYGGVIVVNKFTGDAKYCTSRVCVKLNEKSLQ